MMERVPQESPKVNLKTASNFSQSAIPRPVAKRRYRFGPFRLDPEERRLEAAGGPVELTPKTFQILLMLVENAGHVVAKEDLLARVWPNTVVEEANLTQTVYSLRKALDDGAGGVYIETVPRRGYRFVAPVEGNEAEPGRRIRLRAKRPLALAAVLVIVAGLALGGWLWFRSGHSPMTSIAVLPLLNLSGIPEQQYFADGMTDALITDLAQVRKLRVISRTSVMAYKASHKPLREIAKELGVQALVEGSVQRSGNRIKITAQLINAATDTHLWARAYEGDAKDVLDLQDRVARAIAGDVRRNLTAEEEAHLSHKVGVNQAAYEEYLQGNYFLNKRSPDGIRAAISYFQSAARLAPDYAAAHAGLSSAHTLMALNSNGAEAHQHAESAEAEARRAVALDANLAAGYTALGAARALADYVWTGSESAFRRAMEMDPNDEQAHHWYASLCLLPQRRFAEALAEMQKARQLDPVSVLVYTELGYTLDLAGKDAEALSEYQRALQMDPDFVPLHFRLAEFYDRRGEYGKAVEQVVALSRLQGHTASALRQMAAFHSGGIRAVWRLAAGTRLSFYRAGALVRLGESAQALSDLEQLYALRDPALIYAAVVFPTLRGNPGFQQLLQRIGLKP